MPDTPRTVWLCRCRLANNLKWHRPEFCEERDCGEFELHPVGTHQELVELKQLLAYHEEPRE